MATLLLAGLLAGALSPQEGLHARGERLRKKVEEIRGATFSRPVTLREGSRKEYGSLVVENAKLIYGKDLPACERALKALGLIGRLLNLERALQLYALQGGRAYPKGDDVAMLDPDAGDDEIVFRLTCALADQRFNLTEVARTLGPSFDVQIALAALRQGDGDMTKQLFWAGKKLDEPHADGHLDRLVAAAEKWEKETSRFAGMAVSRLFVRAADFGYRRGGIFLETIRSIGGMAAVDQVYERPPVSTEQVLHPEKYLHDERPAGIDPKPLDDCLLAAGYRRGWATTLGELGVSIVAETLLKEDTGKIGTGWNGDHLSTYEDGAQKPLAVWVTLWDTEKDAITFQAACFRIGRALPAEGKNLNLTLRRGRSVGVLLNLPPETQDKALDALWSCPIRRDDETEQFGEE
ncbi:MAG: hypothetical protein HYY16_12245 [Planctomycetes bacterium]|nr:hypothetical protein [Planctomycetota bacterium]